MRAEVPKNQNLKKFYQIFVVVYFSLKEAAFFWGEYTRQHVNLRDALTCEIHVSHDNKVCLFKLC